MNRKYLDNLLADIRAAYTDAELRRAFTRRTMDDAFREIGLAARPQLADSRKHLAAWTGFEIAVGARMTQYYEWL